MKAPELGSTNVDSNEPLIRRVRNKLDEEYPTPRVPSSASLSSFVNLEVEKLSSVPETLMNSIKSFVGSGILGLPFTDFHVYFITIYLKKASRMGSSKVDGHFL